MRKKIIVILFLVVVSVFTLCSCGVVDKLPDTGDKITIELSNESSSFFGFDVYMTLKHKETGEAYTIVFNSENNYTRTVLLPAGEYIEIEITTSDQQTGGVLTYSEEVTVIDANGEEASVVKNYYTYKATLKSDSANILAVMLYHKPLSFVNIIKNNILLLSLMFVLGIALIVVYAKKNK